MRLGLDRGSNDVIDFELDSGLEKPKMAEKATIWRVLSPEDKDDEKESEKWPFRADPKLLGSVESGPLLAVISS